MLDPPSLDFHHDVPSDLAELLAASSSLKVLWEDLTPLAQNEWICWLTIVKKEETRRAHLVRLSEDLAAGKRRPCCWPGCPHRRGSARKWVG